MTFHRVKSREAAGFQAKHGGPVTIAIRFDPETFAEIKAISDRRRSTFAAVVRELVEFGLIDTEDDA